MMKVKRLMYWAVPSLERLDIYLHIYLVQALALNLYDPRDISILF